METYTLYSLLFKPASFHMAIFFNHKDEKVLSGMVGQGIEEIWSLFLWA